MTGGVLFDLDETLIDRQASILQYGQRFYMDFAGAIIPPEADFLQRFLALDGNGYVAREHFFAALANHLDSPAVTAAAIADHFLQHAWQAPVLMDGAADVCGALRRAGRAIGVVTNGGSRNQRSKLVNSGMAALVDHVVVSEEVGIRKPQPDIFLEACRYLGADPQSSWFVGDNPAVDIHGAAGAGLKTIWMRRALQWPDDLQRCYQHEVTALTQVLEIVLGLARSREVRVT